MGHFADFVWIKIMDNFADFRRVKIMGHFANFGQFCRLGQVKKIDKTPLVKLQICVIFILSKTENLLTVYFVYNFPF